MDMIAENMGTTLKIFTVGWNPCRNVRFKVRVFLNLYFFKRPFPQVSSFEVFSSQDDILRQYLSPAAVARFHYAPALSSQQISDVVRALLAVKTQRTYVDIEVAFLSVDPKVFLENYFVSSHVRMHENVIDVSNVAFCLDNATLSLQVRKMERRLEVKSLQNSSSLLFLEDLFWGDGGQVGIGDSEGGSVEL